MRLIDVDALTEKLGIGKDCNECQHNEDEFYCNWKPDVVDICEAICTAQTIEPEQHWIPCSERLPEEKKEVLASGGGFLYIAMYERASNGTVYWSEVMEYRCINVDAWMELPERYEGDDHA